MKVLDRIAFWRKPEPAPSGECTHLWSNWSEPEEVEVSSYWMMGGQTTTSMGYRQNRHCLKCNVYERRTA